ncbi:MAG: hypothetical protein R2932_58345 [Caldilineaceae bacterium]
MTPEALSSHFGGLPVTQITVSPCPALGALVIAMRNSLGGGVTRSLGVDIHGKTRSGYLLGMRVAWPSRAEIQSHRPLSKTLPVQKT